MTPPASSSNEPASPATNDSAKRWAWMAYPACMVVSMSGAAIAVDMGLPPLLIYALVSALSLLFVLFGEWRRPFRTRWMPGWRENYRPDGLLFLLNNAVLQSPTVQLLVAAAAIELAGGGLALWPAEAPLWLAVPAGLIIAEFGSYWWHRACHEWPPLWRFHQLHHSPERLYWLNATRFHYLDVTLLQVAAVLPLLLLGAPATVVLFVTLFSIFHGYWQHGNTVQQLGWLNYLVSGAELHRWHHNRKAMRSNHNYGSNLIIWDLLFASFYWPERGHGRAEGASIDDIGLEDPNYPQHLSGQLLFPFRR